MFSITYSKLAIDEMVVRYYGRHSAIMLMKTHKVPLRTMVFVQINS